MPSAPLPRDAAGSRWVAPIVGLLGALFAVGLLALGARDAGGFAFPLDDAYIHMAVARTLVESATWGVNPGEHASALSSPAWTLLLAVAFRILGEREWIPVVLNLVALTGVAWTVDRALLGAAFRPAARLATGLAVLTLTPLPVLAALGMEHVWHLWLALLLANSVANSKQTSVATMAALGSVLPMFRYEAMFEVGVAVLLLGARGRRRRTSLLPRGPRPDAVRRLAGAGSPIGNGALTGNRRTRA